MKQWDTVAIVGVGLIGGSIGLALRERWLAERVIGIGRSAASLRDALEVDAITSGTTDLAEGVARAEVVVVATPVAGIAEHVMQVAKACPQGTLITDAGSTKAAIVAALEGKLPRGAPYVGSHPIAGSEKTGARSASGELFVGRVAVVTPTKSSPPDTIERASAFWSALGSTVRIMSPDEHDRALAATSHLPHLIAALLSGATPRDDLSLTAGGWADATRIAAAAPELWVQIFMANRSPVLDALARFEGLTAAAKAAIEAGDAERLLAILNEGKRIRDALGS